LPQALLRQREEAALGGNAEIAGERQLEPDAEAIALGRGDHRLGAARRRGDVPCQTRDMLGRGLEKPADFTAAGKMLADRSHDDDAHLRVRLERGAQLVALRHGDDVERRSVED
jgi:hypothetical protein